MATPRNIVIRESAGIPRRDEPVRVSVPFARGELRDPQQAGVLDPQGLGLRVAWNLATLLTFDYGFSDEDSGFYINLSQIF